MITFIAERIKVDTDKSLTQGQDKYRAYFVKTSIYRKYQEDVNTILQTDGYTDAIVTE